MRHILDPHPLENPLVSYAVLVFAAVVEGVSWRMAFREFRARKGDLGYFEAAQKTKDPTTLTVFLEVGAALIGIAFAFLGTVATQVFDQPAFDGMASIAIGFLLAVEDIEARVRKARPEVMMVLVKPQTAKAHAEAVRVREGPAPPA